MLATYEGLILIIWCSAACVTPKLIYTTKLKRAVTPLYNYCNGTAIVPLFRLGEEPVEP